MARKIEDLSEPRMTNDEIWESVSRVINLVAIVEFQQRHLLDLGLLRRAEKELQKINSIAQKVETRGDDSLTVRVAATLSAQLSVIYDLVQRGQLTFEQSKTMINQLVPCIYKHFFTGNVPSKISIDAFLVLPSEVIAGRRQHSRLGEHPDIDKAGGPGIKLMADFVSAGFFGVSYRLVMDFRSKELDKPISSGPSRFEIQHGINDYDYAQISGVLANGFGIPLRKVRAALAALGTHPEIWLP
jgi:hypothetical protein